MSDIQKQYNKDTPKSQMTTHAINHNANQSISIGIVFAVVIWVSVIQILSHQRLKQDALHRLFLTHHSQLKLYSTYIITHVIILCILVLISIGMHQPLSIWFYLKSIIILVVYEFGMALLFKSKCLKSSSIYGDCVCHGNKCDLYMDSIIKECDKYDRRSKRSETL